MYGRRTDGRAAIVAGLRGGIPEGHNQGMVTPTTQPATRQQTRDTTDLEPRYHLILLDDNDHTYEYVIDLLGRVLGYGREKSFALACVVDSEGQAIVETGSHEQLTQHQQQIHAFGADPRIPRCVGSMSAIVEPAE
jgi:ATP-dependent Clp protease adaptor protein ClpS